VRLVTVSPVRASERFAEIFRTRVSRRQSRFLADEQVRRHRLVVFCTVSEKWKDRGCTRGGLVIVIGVLHALLVLCTRRLKYLLLLADGVVFGRTCLLWQARCAYLHIGEGDDVPYLTLRLPRLSARSPCGAGDHRDELWCASQE